MALPDTFLWGGAVAANQLEGGSEIPFLKADGTKVEKAQVSLML